MATVSRMWRVFGLVAVLVCLLSASAAAQTGSITGVITDEQNQVPVPGAQVRVAGTTLGAVSSDSGRYTIAQVPPGTYTLEVRRLGYAPTDRGGVVVTAGTPTTVNLTIRQTSLRLEQIVVTGVVDPTAGTRVPFTVGKVTKEEMPVPPVNAVESIQGKVSGVQVVSSSEPGTGTNIMLRTPTSINKTNFPLVVVDGVIMSSAFGASTADLSSLDVESVEIIKGAAAASLYGSRAANGVIQIRTARGRELALGQTRIVARSEFGANQIASPVEWSRYHSYRVNEDLDYIGSAGNVVVREDRILRLASEQFQDVPYKETWDHVGAFFDPGTFSTSSITLSQNLGSTNFLATIATNRQSGVVMDHGGYRRNDARINLDHRLRDNLSVAFSGYHMRSTKDELYGNVFFDLLNTAPDVNLLEQDPDGTPYAFQPDPQGIRPNPLYLLTTQSNETKRARTLGSADVTYAPRSWLTFDANVSYDRSDRNAFFYVPRGKKDTNTGSSIGEIELFNGTTNAINASASANFLGQFGDLTARMTVRGLMEKEENETFEAQGSNLAVSDVPDLDAARDRNITSGFQEIRANGYFLTLGADYAGKYIADALVRRDGSSLFGPEERWHTYYRASLAYRLSEEAWWPFEQVNEFKLRVSQGTAGGRPSFADQYETYTITGSGELEKATLGNVALKPELARETEFGLDAIFLDRFSLQLSYAHTLTKDQLIELPLSAPYGFEERWINAGTVEGRTIEGTFEAELMSSADMRWSATFIADRSRHKITEYDRFCHFSGVAWRCAGETLGSIWGNTWVRSADQLSPAVADRADEFQVNDDGFLVWVGNSESWRAPQWGAQFSDDLGNVYRWGHPIILRAEDNSPVVTRIGDSNPDFHWGLSSNFRWRNLTLYGLLDAQVGGDVYNNTRQRMFQYDRHKDQDQAGKPPELKKAATYYNTTLYNGNTENSYFIEDGSFVSLRELSVRYRLPASILGAASTLGLDGVTLGVVGRNLWMVTDYKGYGPEVGSPLARYDSFDYPQFRTFTGMIEITF